jgi:hypothetical protein
LPSFAYSILHVHNFFLSVLLPVKVRERLSVNKQRSHRFHMERFNVKKLNEVEANGEVSN